MSVGRDGAIHVEEQKLKRCGARAQKDRLRSGFLGPF